MDYELHDGMAEALQEARTEAARYKAERDIARQELDRLREERGGEDREAEQWEQSEQVLDESWEPDRDRMPPYIDWPRYEDGEQVVPGEDGITSVSFTWSYDYPRRGVEVAIANDGDYDVRRVGERFERLTKPTGAW